VEILFINQRQKSDSNYFARVNYHFKEDILNEKMEFKLILVLKLKKENIILIAIYKIE
jgi:hypothetical protein